MHSVLSVALVMVLSGPAVLPTAATATGPTWLDWVINLRMQISQIVQVIADIREALAGAGTQWWREGLADVSHALAVSEVQPVLTSLMTTLEQLPRDLRRELQALIDRIAVQAAPSTDTDGTAETLRVAIAMDPRLREAERRSLSRQTATASALALSAAVQQASDQIATTLTRSTAAIDATQQAVADAQTLQRSVAGAQSSRALLQYLGEGLADLMRQQATFSGVISQQLAALSQQDALSARDLQLIISVLAQDALAQEQARRGQVAARQEALRLLAEGYSQSLFAVGGSLLDLQGRTPDRRRQLLEAISPTR